MYLVLRFKPAFLHCASTESRKDGKSLFTYLRLLLSVQVFQFHIMWHSVYGLSFCQSKFLKWMDTIESCLTPRWICIFSLWSDSIQPYWTRLTSIAINWIEQTRTIRKNGEKVIKIKCYESGEKWMVMFTAAVCLLTQISLVSFDFMFKLLGKSCTSALGV